MAIQSEPVLPVLAATGTFKGFGITGEIFDIRKVVFVQVEVQSAWVFSVRSANECGSNVGCFVFVTIVFTMALGWRETIDLNVDFV